MKRCNMCENVLAVEQFSVDRYKRDGRRTRCKPCESKIRKNRYLLNKEQYLSKHKERLATYRAEYRRKNKAALSTKYAEYRRANLEQELARHAKYRRENKDKIREATRHARTNPNRRIKDALRLRVYLALKNVSKSAKTLALLGCTIDELRRHLETKFTPGMTWENYGVRGWHIDHIRPCASFDLTQPDEQRKCFNFANLQPLWAHDNMSKGARLKWESLLMPPGQPQAQPPAEMVPGAE